MKPGMRRHRPVFAALVIALAIAFPHSLLADNSPCSLLYYQIIADDPVCALSSGNLAYVTGSWDNATYVWEIFNGTIDSGQGTGRIYFTAGASAGYGGTSLKVTITAPACGAPMIDTRPISVRALTEVLVAAPPEVCPLSRRNIASVINPGSEVYSLWTIRGGSILQWNDNASIVEFSAGYSGQVELSTRPASGCWLAVPTIVPIRPTSTGSIEAQNACAFSEGNVARVPDAGPGATYDWTIDYGASINSLKPYGSSLEFSAGAVGSALLRVKVGTPDGCSLEFSRLISILSSPVASITAPSSTCSGSSGNIATVADAGPGALYVWTIEGGTITSSPSTSSITFSPVPAAESVTLRVSVQSVSGCSQANMKTVAVLEHPSAEIVARSSICSGSRDNFASVADAGTDAAYVWTIEHGSILSSSPRGPSILFSPEDGASVVTLGVTVQLPQGCESSSTFPIAVSPTPSAAIQAGPSCARSSNNRASVADAGAGASYEWLISNGVITSAQPHGPVIEYTAGEGPDPVTLQVTVRSQAQCRDSRIASLAIVNCDQYCSLLQSFYGAEEGRFNFEDSEALINRLLPVSVGISGRRLTIPVGGARCVLELLPARGTPSPLPDGEQLVGPTSCDTVEPTESDGRLRNSLLGEMLTLALNVKLQDEKLLTAPLCAALATQPADPGSAGLYGDSDDRPHPGADGVRGPNCAVDSVLCPDDDPVRVHSIHAAVLHALDESGLPRTGSGLLQLGDLALSGHSVRGVSLEAVQSAISAFNAAYAECRFLVGCVEPGAGRGRPASRRQGN